MPGIAVIGGKLQGTEVVYLARKAGFKSLLIDKRSEVPASGLCDEMGVFDVLKKEEGLVNLLKKADFILPALENSEVHAALAELAKEYGFKLMFDMQAYAVSSSKLKSDSLMRKHGIPLPEYFPGNGGPYIIKPSGESGSTDVMKVGTKEEVSAFLSQVKDPGKWVIQEFLAGPSYSIEIIGIPGVYRTYEITQIHMDADYDCNMVTAPCALSLQAQQGFSDMAVKLANMVNLTGIMDVEVIDHNGVLKVLEIDARFPSQTPIAVYHSTGVNLLSELAKIAGGDTPDEPAGDIHANNRAQCRLPCENKEKRFVSVEHYLIDRSGIHLKGEHIMTEGGPLLYKENFFGADEALTDYVEGSKVWRAMFINSGKTEQELTEKRLFMARRLAAADA